MGVNELTSNYIPHIIGLILIVLLCAPNKYWKRLAERLAVHSRVQPSDVKSLTFWSTGPEGRREWQGSEDEIEQIVNRFNDAVFLQKREHYKESDVLTGALMQLGSGETIEILLTGPDVDIRRTKAGKKNVVYWAKNDQLKQELSELQPQLAASGETEAAATATATKVR